MTALRSAAAGGPATLVVSPSLQGHRVIYCRVLAGVLAEEGRRVVVAGDLRDGAVSGDPLVRDLGAREGVELVDLGELLHGRAVPARDLAALAARAGADTVLLAEADDFAGELGLLRRVDGAPAGLRVVGLFVRSTNYQYRARPTTVARARLTLKRRFGRGSGREEFYTRALRGRGLVDAALVLDERYACEHPRTHSWLPDIFREFDEPVAAPDDETARWEQRLHVYLADAGARPVLVYVGTNQHRRGYDTLLRLALEVDGCVVHCGRFVLDGEPSDAEVTALRAELEARGALFETGGPYVRPETAAVFLRAARCVVLPYRQHDGSSGVMLQALAAGRPVLVPDRGLMAYRARTFGLGVTFRDGDAADLRRRFAELQTRGPVEYAARLDAYMGFFSRTQVSAAVRAAVAGAGPGARLPQEALCAPAAERSDAR